MTNEEPIDLAAEIMKRGFNNEWIKDLPEFTQREIRERVRRSAEEAARYRTVNQHRTELGIPPFPVLYETGIGETRVPGDQRWPIPLHPGWYTWDGKGDWSEVTPEMISRKAAEMTHPKLAVHVTAKSMFSDAEMQDMKKRWAQMNTYRKRYQAGYRVGYVLGAVLVALCVITLVGLALIMAGVIQ